MGALILYESMGGTTARYAQWLGQALGAPVLSRKACTSAQLDQADCLVFGAPVRGGQIRGLKRFHRLQKKIGKPALLFAVGLRPDTPRTREILSAGNDLDGLPFFYLPGGLTKETLSNGDRTMLRCYRAMLQRRQTLRQDEQLLLTRFQTDGDYTDREALQPLLRAIRTGDGPLP